jgi:pimeloyl-ACP methyl ester carboxylesterase
MKALLMVVAFWNFLVASNSTLCAPVNSDTQLQGVRCPSASFVTMESGKIVAVDWVEHQADSVHTRMVLMQSRVVDATIQIRADETAAHSSVVLSIAGEPPEEAKERSLGDGAIYWSDFITSSVEQAVARARVLNVPVAHLPAASLYSDSRGDVLVERIDGTDWTVTYHHKRYIVLTDKSGCMLSALLPEFGVVIERRTIFGIGEYPLWAPYDTPPDHGYSAKEVIIPTTKDHVLAATLTLPLHVKSSPAVVLITGLGPSERNGGAPPWMPLRDVADALTKAGIAVLRVDDRGVGKSTGDHASSTTYDEADDVESEVKWLRAQPDIKSRRIALVGYSEGSLIAAMIAAKDPTIAAIVSLAGSGVPGPQLAREQIEQVVLRDSTVAAADREKEIEKQLAEPMTVRERVFLTIDPQQYASLVRCPALIVQGGSDITVPLRSAEKLASFMRSSGNQDVTVRVIPGVSHSLLPDPLGLSSEWVFLPAFETSPQVLNLMADWLGTRLR